MRRLVLLSALLGTSPAMSETPGEALRLSGSSRLRYETIDGQARTGPTASESLVNLRTTLSAEYGRGPIKIGGEIYDSRAYNAGPNSALSTGEVNALELVQAYVSADLGLALGKGTKTSIQAGRFLLNLGSRRLVAADDYRNTTNSYTGLRANLSAPGGWAGTLIYTLPQVRLPADFASLRDNEVGFDRESFDLRLWGGTVAKANALGTAAIDIAYYRLDERDAPSTPTRNRHLDTVSARIIRAPAAGRLDFEIEGIRQTGRVRTSAAPLAPFQSVSAWFAHADLGYQFATPLKARLSIEYDYASGGGRGGTFRRFDSLFGMRRADLGPAGLYNSIGRSNISTPGVRLEVSPNKRFDAFMSYREMWLAFRFDGFSTTGVRDATGRSGRYAGRQVEGRMRWWAVPERLQLEIDAVLLDKGRFLLRAPNAPAGGDTRYLSLNATAVF